ncbi:phosphatidylglycerol lysyltransferase domain-containing protein [Aurantimonas sp. Leaf443]|uniref:phosphatidylglycerol lysyltransferase domain-containing protein n=1 Tax=Aurantimonas sp. Leaf443 TaxID=1736378 RepID=UPI0006F7C85B|nr:phosphatidylglycerol lysyltransferase domain-containing protein [Aurantimonas sp. Leaf443]KQT84013.1 hypothetical protein ASG48_11575 [Aurantimonas sp. Leaf443]
MSLARAAGNDAGPSPFEPAPPAPDAPAGPPLVEALRRRGFLAPPTRRRRGAASGPARGEALSAALAIVERQGCGEANLARMGDKDILLAEEGDAFVMYARRGRSLVALGDPVGNRERLPGLVERFAALARAEGARPVFYQASQEFLQAAAPAGLRGYKLGEQALVDLPGFDMKGGRWANLRRATNRAERDGLAFAMVEAGGVAALMTELEEVSRQWLAHHRAREKGFSLGTFDPAYLAGQPVATMRFEGRLVAFASVLSTPVKGGAFIDLMRFAPGVHRGLMDLLFVRIIETLRADGFATLNLGMAPLKGIAEAPGTPVWNRVGQAVFERGEQFYNFKGLLAFKAKFEPRWEPRFLAVPAASNPYLAAMDVAILIGGGLRGVLGK